MIQVFVHYYHQIVETMKCYFLNLVIELARKTLHRRTALHYPLQHIGLAVHTWGMDLPVNQLWIKLKDKYRFSNECNQMHEIDKHRLIKGKRQLTMKFLCFGVGKKNFFYFTFNSELDNSHYFNSIILNNTRIIPIVIGSHISLVNCLVFCFWI